MQTKKIIIMDNIIGEKVEKISKKPFKSKFKVNTIKGIIYHPQRIGKLAYTFYEDDSYVSMEQCKLIE